MTVSIIIAVKTWQKNLEECVAKILELDYPDFEIIILPDEALADGLLVRGAIPITVIPTGPVNPAEKRDLGIKHAKGEIIAFIDDDAYPVKDWLKAAIVNFKDPEVAGITKFKMSFGGDVVNEYTYIYKSAAFRYFEKLAYLKVISLRFLYSIKKIFHGK